MAYDKTNKKLYVTEDSGITPWEIAQCLDDYRVNTKGQRDVGMLCTSPNINMWAKYKPIRRPEFTLITEEQRSKASYGLDVSGAHDSTYDGLLTKAFNNQGAYKYLKPRGLATYKEPFRVRDFEGYWHNAPMPYKYTFQYSYGMFGEGPITGWFDVYLATGAQLKLSEIDPTLLPSSDMSKCNIVLLYRKVGELYGGGYIFPKINGKYITLADVETEGSTPVCRFSIPGTNNYRFVIAVTDATEDNIEDMYWMYLPEALFPKSGGGGGEPVNKFSWAYAGDYGVSHSISSSSGGISQVRVQLRIEGYNYTGTNGGLTVEIGEMDGGMFSSIGSAYQADYLVPETIKESNLVINTSEGLSTSKLYIRAYIEWKEAETSTTTNYLYFDFIAGKQSQTDPGPVSLAQIYDAWEW